MTLDRKRRRTFHTDRNRSSPFDLDQVPARRRECTRGLLGLALDQAVLRANVHDDVMISQFQIVRLKALMCEQRARETTDPAGKESWQELAIEWHAIANASAKADDDTPQLQFS